VNELTLLCLPYLEKTGLIEKISLDWYRIKETGEEVSLPWLEK